MTDQQARVRRGLRRTSYCLLGAALVASAVIIGLTTWGWRSAEAAGGVQVVAGPGPITCNDGTIPLRTSDEDREPAVVVRMDARPGAWCQVPISVRNTSSHSITIRDLTIPATLRDEDDNTGALIVTTDSSGVPPHGRGKNNDAVIDVGEVVKPGESWTDLIRLEINPSACVSAGEWSVRDTPRVRFTVLRRDHDVSGAITLAARIPGAGLSGTGCEQ